jgi:hypothetical protein
LKYPHLLFLLYLFVYLVQTMVLCLFFLRLVYLIFLFDFSFNFFLRWISLFICLSYISFVWLSFKFKTFSFVSYLLSDFVWVFELGFLILYICLWHSFSYRSLLSCWVALLSLLIDRFSFISSLVILSVLVFVDVNRLFLLEFEHIFMCAFWLLLLSFFCHLLFACTFCSLLYLFSFVFTIFLNLYFVSPCLLLNSLDCTSKLRGSFFSCCISFASF